MRAGGGEGETVPQHPREPDRQQLLRSADGPEAGPQRGEVEQRFVDVEEQYVPCVVSGHGRPPEWVRGCGFLGVRPSFRYRPGMVEARDEAAVRRPP